MRSPSSWSSIAAVLLALSTASHSVAWADVTASPMCASTDQAKVIQSICKTLGLKAFREDIGGLKPLD